MIGNDTALCLWKVFDISQATNQSALPRGRFWFQMAPFSNSRDTFTSVQPEEVSFGDISYRSNQLFPQLQQGGMGFPYLLDLYN